MAASGPSRAGRRLFARFRLIRDRLAAMIKGALAVHAPFWRRVSGTPCSGVVSQATTIPRRCVAGRRSGGGRSNSSPDVAERAAGRRVIPRSAALSSKPLRLCKTRRRVTRSIAHSSKGRRSIASPDDVLTLVNRPYETVSIAPGRVWQVQDGRMIPILGHHFQALSPPAKATFPPHRWPR